MPREAYISAKAMATIEFLQQEWINGENFIGIGSEGDPIIGLQGDDATFTIPHEPDVPKTDAPHLVRSVTAETI